MGDIDEASGIDESFGDDRADMWGPDLPEADEGELTSEATVIVVDDIMNG